MMMSDEAKSFARSRTPRKTPPSAPPPDHSLYTNSDYQFIIMDSGCTTPILDDKSLFRTLHASIAVVRTADGNNVQIAQEGPADIVVVDRNGN